jgi:hypothetical protein
VAYSGTRFDAQSDYRRQETGTKQTESGFVLGPEYEKYAVDGHKLAIVRPWKQLGPPGYDAIKGYLLASSPHVLNLRESQPVTTRRALLVRWANLPAGRVIG